MWRIFSLAILALIPVGRVGAQDKRSLIVEVLQTAGDYGDIAPVWGIVQKDGDIYRFVPSVALGFQTRYAHLTLIYTRKGAKVEKGDVIGFVGSTGISTGNHLHYEVIKNQKRINPLNFIYGTK